MLGRAGDGRGERQEEGYRGQAEYDQREQDLVEGVARSGATRGPRARSPRSSTRLGVTRVRSHAWRSSPTNIASRPVPTKVALSPVGCAASSMTVPVFRPL